MHIIISLSGLAVSRETKSLEPDCDRQHLVTQAQYHTEWTRAALWACPTSRHPWFLTKLDKWVRLGWQILDLQVKRCKLLSDVNG